MIRRLIYITGGVASTATLLVSMGCGPSATTAAPTASSAGGAPTTAPTAAGAAATSAPAATSAGAAATSAPTTGAAETPAAGAATGEAAPTTGAAPTSGSTPASAGTTGAATPAVGTTPAAEGTRPPAPTPSPPRSPLSVPANDLSIVAGDIEIPGDGVTLKAYQARPQAADTKMPVVLICHENRGLTEHIRDVARRYAKANYVACAVDLLSRDGGTAGVADPAQVPALLSGADPARHVSDFQAAAKYYQSQEFIQADRIGMTGFCFGGGITWRAATAMAELKAAAPYYGPPPPLEAVPNIKAAVLGVYSSDPGDFANNGRDELEQTLKDAGVTYEFKVYPNTQHAFNNDTGQRYNEEQALAAWNDTLAWFEQHLRNA